MHKQAAWLGINFTSPGRLSSVYHGWSRALSLGRRRCGCRRLQCRRLRYLLPRPDALTPALGHYATWEAARVHHDPEELLRKFSLPLRRKHLEPCPLED